MAKTIAQACLLGMFVALAGCATQPRPAQQFDLICQGKMTEGHDGASVFQTLLTVDIDKGRLCINHCQRQYRLLSRDKTKLEFAYSDALSEGHRPNGEIVVSSAGPWEKYDSLTVNLSNGDFRRSHRYTEGDIVAHDHDEQFQGRCARRRYSGMAPYIAPRF